MDNGWENIFLHEVDPNINLYYCDPYHPNQKALVERMIRDLRVDTDLSDGVCFDHLDEAKIKQINDDFNATKKFFSWLKY